MLVGPSGCGKTTALRMVAGLEDVTSGTISIDGRPVNDVEPRHRDIAMVFQSYALYPHLSVYDNMAFSLKYRRVAKAEIRQRVAEAARILELEPYLQRKPRQLSGGQRQRVAMGRAIVRQPRAFLMDEPLSNLDAKLRVQMRAEIAPAAALARHDDDLRHPRPDRGDDARHRVAVISGGVLQQVAAPQELYRRPANLFVAGFIGSPPMNLIDARLERGGAGGAGDGGPGRGVRPAPARDTAGGRRRASGLRALPRRAPSCSASGPSTCTTPRSRRRLRVGDQLPVRLREELGSEVQVHGAIGTAAHVSDDAADDVRSLATIVARMDPRTKIAEGETAEIAVDTAELQFFDPASGDSILA